MTDDAMCDVRMVDAAAVDAARARQADDGELQHLADTFQILASPTRLRIVEALAHGELCVCDLSAVVGVSESAVSHHLRNLRQLRIVRFRKDGRMAYYRLDDDHVGALFGLGLEHVRE
jgi:DNA-binding transcriptional ArsR family regulator